VKTKKFKGVISRAYRKPVSPALPYDGEYQRFEQPEEVRAAGEWPNEKGVMAYANAKRKAAAAAAIKKAVLDAAGIFEPNVENDEQFRLQQMFDSVMASKKYTEEQARELCSTTLGIEWADEDDDE